MKHLYSRAIQSVIQTLIAIITATLFASTAHALSGSFTLYPSYTHNGSKQWIIHDVSTGDTIRDFVTLENLSDQEMPITLNFHEAETGKEKTDFRPVISEEFQNLGNWLQIDKKSITVKPHSKEKIAFTLKIPDNANPKSYGGVIFAEHAMTFAEGSLPLTTRIGVRMYIDVKTPALTPSIPAKTMNELPFYFSALVLITAISLLLISKRTVTVSVSGIAILIIGNLLIMGNPTNAQVMEVEITRGGYSLKGPAQIIFPKIKTSFEETLSTTNFRKLEDISYLEIEDASGGTPFSVSISASDFTSTDSETRIIPNSFFSIRNNDDEDPKIQTIEGDSIGVELNPTTDSFVPLNETQTIFDRLDGENPGKWRIFPSLQLTIPPNTKSGIYNTNIIFTII